MKSLRIVLSLALILVVVFIAFTPCLKNGFMDSWDDQRYVTGNTVIQHWSWHNVAHIFSDFFISTYLPVTMLSYMINFHFSGLDPFGYHLTNLIFHLLNCLLVFWFIQLLFRNTLVSLITAVFFGVHPLHVESVAWVSERKDVLYAFFFLLSMVCYCYYLKVQKMGKAYGLSLAFFILSLLSKAMAITLPALLFLVDYSWGRKLDRRMVADKILFWVFALCFGAWGVYGQLRAIRNEHIVGFFDKLIIPSYAIIFYLQKILYPKGLSGFYPRFGVDDVLAGVFSLVSCLMIIFLTIRSMRHTKKIVVGVLFFLITLLPVLQFVPLGSITVADRYTYMASIGIFYLVAELAVWLYKKAAKKNRGLSFAVMTLALSFMVGGLSTLTWNQCAVWKDGITLWSDALNKYPSLAWAYNQRGGDFLNKKDYARALTDFKALLLYAPYDAVAYVNLANAYNAMGKNNEAIAVLKRGLRVGKEPAVVYFGLANTYAALNNNEAAVSSYKKSLELDSANAVVYYSLGGLYEKLGKKDDAIQMLKQAIKINPDFLLPFRMLLRLYEERGNQEEQLALCRQAIAYDVPFYEGYYDVGNLYLKQGNAKLAIRMFQRAVEINPASAEGYVGLGSAYSATGQTKKAIVFLAKALKMDPNIAIAHNNIAFSYFCQKQYSLAIQHCDKAIALGYEVNSKLLELLKPFRK